MPTGVIQDFNVSKQVNFDLIQKNKLFSEPQLPINNQYYQNYCCYLYETILKNGYDDHVAYLTKKSFDDVLLNFDQEQLINLMEKQDLYLEYIILCSLENLCLIQKEEFNCKIHQLKRQFTPNQDETLYLLKIQSNIKQSLQNKISPFTFLNNKIPWPLTGKQKQIIIQIMKYCLSCSTWYDMKPEVMFGLAFKQFLKYKKIKPQTIEQLVSNYLDPKCSYIKKKMIQISQIIQNILETQQKIEQNHLRE